MLIESSVFCRWFNCVVWLDSVACSDEHVARMCMLRLSTFRCSLFWRRWSHDATLDSKEFLVFISYSTISLLYCVDVILMLKWHWSNDNNIQEKIKILQEKFFLSFFQTNINNITNSFIFLIMSSDLRISEDEVRQTIKRIKADKASNISDILNRVLQTDLAKLILILTSLFNACVIYRYHSKQFKKIQMIVLCKSKKSDYIDSKTC